MTPAPPQYWDVIEKALASGALVSLLGWLLGRPAQRAKQRLDEKAGEQNVLGVQIKSNENTIGQLSARVTTLESSVENLRSHVDTLREEKYELQKQIVELKTRLGEMAVAAAAQMQDYKDAQDRIAMIEFEKQALLSDLKDKEGRLFQVQCELDALRAAKQ